MMCIKWCTVKQWMAPAKHWWYRHYIRIIMVVQSINTGGVFRKYLFSIWQIAFTACQPVTLSVTALPFLEYTNPSSTSLDGTSWTQPCVDFLGLRTILSSLGALNWRLLSISPGRRLLLARKQWIDYDESLQKVVKNYDNYTILRYLKVVGSLIWSLKFFHIILSIIRSLISLNIHIIYSEFIS